MLKWKNNAAGTLGANVLAGDTSITLSAGHGARFPATSAQDWFKATLRDSSNNLEIIYVRSRTVDTLDVVVRAQDGTTAAAFSTNDAIEVRWANADVLGAQDEAVTGPTASGTDTYTANLRVAPKAYNTGQVYAVNVANANTSATPTLNLSALGAKTIKRRGGIAVAIGDVSGLCLFHYNGTDMILMNPAGGDEPPGTIAMSGRSFAPTGWLALDGSSVSRTTYAALYQAVGDQFGPGDGSTTFTLPNPQGRAPMGIGQGNTAEGGGAGTFRNLGDLAGAEFHTLNTSQLPNHSHSITDPTHIHGITDPSHVHGVTVASGSAQGGAGASGLGIGSSDPATTGVTVQAAGTGISVVPEGGGAAHNNMSPVIAFLFIIKQ